MFNFCWFKSDQFYEKRLSERPTSSFAIESASWANQQPHGHRCTGNLRIHHAASMWLKPMQFANQFIHHELEDQRNKYSSQIWKRTIFGKKKTLMPILRKCDTLGKSVFTDPQHHCASRGNAVPVSRTPPESESHARATRDYPRKSALLKRCTFTGLSAAVKDALMSTTSSKSAGRETNNSSRDAKTISMDIENMSETCLSSVFAFFTDSLTEKIVADSPSLRLCVLIRCWKIALLRLPKVQLWDTICDLASMDSSDVKRLPSWNILLRKLSM